MSSRTIVNANEIEGGVSVNKNYILNPNANKNLSGWVVYKDASGALPVDGTGNIGGAVVTFANTISTPLRGNASYLIETTAVDLRGSGVSYDFTIDYADRAKILTISFDYRIASGTYVTGDFTVYIYDTINNVVIEPTGHKIEAIGGGLPHRHVASFQTSSNSSNYRLIFHRAVTTATAVGLAIDSVSISPQVVVMGTPSTNWQLYTPTCTNFTIFGATRLWWRRDGSDLILRGEIPVGNITGDVNFTLPPGLVAAGSISDNGNARSCGAMNYIYGAEVHLGIMYCFGNVISMYGDDGAGQWNASNPRAVVVDSVAFQVQSFRVAIVGWDTNCQMSDSSDTRVVAAIYNTSAGQTIEGANETVVWGTKVTDTHNAMNTSTGVYTVPVPGKYRVSAMICYASGAWVAGNLDVIKIQKNGSAQAYFQKGMQASVTERITNQVTDTVDCVAGDTIAISLEHNRTAGAINMEAVSIQNRLAIERISGPSAIAASEKIVARAVLTTEQNGITTKVIPFNSKSFDSHGAFDVTTNVGRFTAPRSDYYRVKAWALMGSADSASNAHLQIQKNGAAVIEEYGSVLTATTTAVALRISDIIQLNAGQYIDIRIVGDASFDIDNGSARTGVYIESV